MGTLFEGFSSFPVPFSLVCGLFWGVVLLLLGAVGGSGVSGVVLEPEPVLSPMPELSLKILDLTRERGRITLASAVELTGANRNTTKQHLQKLVDAGHLTRHGAGRGVWYGLA